MKRVTIARASARWLAQWSISEPERAGAKRVPYAPMTFRYEDADCGSHMASENSVGEILATSHGVDGRGHSTGLILDAAE